MVAFALFILAAALVCTAIEQCTNNPGAQVGRMLLLAIFAAISGWVAYAFGILKGGA